MEHTHNSDWIIIDWSKVETKRNETVHGVNIKVFVSPYDVPKAVRGYLDEEKGKFVIEFNYLNEELTEIIPHSEYVTYELGKISHRLRAIELNIEAMKHEDGKLRITEFDRVVSAINDLLKPSKRKIPVDNYELAKEVFKAKRNEILAEAI